MPHITFQYNLIPDSNFGINLEFGRRPTWLITPFFTIIIIRKPDDKKRYYTNDFFSLRKSFHGLNVYKHTEPENNNRFFNLGFNSKHIFFGNYIITFRKFKDQLPIIHDCDYWKQILPRFLCSMGSTHDEINEFIKSGQLEEILNK